MRPSGTTSQLLNRLRMRQVALLLAIEERHTLRAAAQALGMTQPAATQMLQELESTLGHVLFDRVGRGLQVTAAGALATAYFHGLRGTVESLNRDMNELREGSAGKLRIGSIMAASPAHLTDALIVLKQQHPLLAVEIAVETSDHLTQQLRDGVLELVIGRVPDLSAHDFHLRPIAEEALSVVAAVDHPLAGIGALPFAAMCDFPWILQPCGSPMRDVMEQEFRSHHCPLPKGLIETASILTTTNLLMSTQMIAVIPDAVASRYQKHGLLCILGYAIRHRLPSYGSIVRRDRPLSRPAQRLVALLHGGRELGGAAFDEPTASPSPSPSPGRQCAEASAAPADGDAATSPSRSGKV